MEQLESGWETAVFRFQRSEQLPESIRAAEITKFSGSLEKKKKKNPQKRLSKAVQTKRLPSIGATRGMNAVADKKEKKKIRLGQRESPLRSLEGVCEQGGLNLRGKEPEKFTGVSVTPLCPLMRVSIVN